MAPQQSLGTHGRRGHTHDTSVLIAVQPASFERLLGHVLQGQPGLRVVGSAQQDSVARKAARLTPDLIIANTRLYGKEPGDVLADLKRSSPASTLILLTRGLGEPVPHSGADACLPEDAVVQRLLAVIHKVMDPLRIRRVPQPSSSGPHA